MIGGSAYVTALTAAIYKELVLLHGHALSLHQAAPGNGGLLIMRRLCSVSSVVGSPSKVRSHEATD